MSFLIYLSQLPSEAVLIPTLETKELRFTEGHTQGQAVIEGHIWDSNPNLWASVFPSATVLSGKGGGSEFPTEARYDRNPLSGFHSPDLGQLHRLLQNRSVILVVSW